jgi:undecaprenyl pyrophosphate synthase
VSEVLEAMVELVKRELLVVEEITVDSVSHLSFFDWHVDLPDVELVLRTSVGKCVGIVVEVMP